MANKQLAKLGYDMLASMYQTATGNNVTISNTSDYISVYEKLENIAGVEGLLGIAQKAVSKVILKNMGTMKDRYSFIDVSSDRYGEMLVKQRIFARAIDEDDAKFYRSDNMTTLLKDGSEVDQWKVKKYYVEARATLGTISFTDHMTQFYSQLDSAFENAESLGRVVSAMLQTFKNNFKNWKLGVKQNLFVDYALSLRHMGTTNPELMTKINLITEYNDKFGYTSTDTNFCTKDNWFKHGIIEDFCPWCYYRIKEVLGQMENFDNYHTVPIVRETPPDVDGHTEIIKYLFSAQNVKTVFISEFLTFCKQYVETYAMHPEKFVEHDYSTIDAWENVYNKYRMCSSKIHAVNVANDKYEIEDYTVPTSSVAVDTIIGVAYTDESIGIVNKKEFTLETPWNARGAYKNQFIHCEIQPIEDFNEKGCVFCLE